MVTAIRISSAATSTEDATTGGSATLTLSDVTDDAVTSAPAAETTKSETTGNRRAKKPPTAIANITSSPETSGSSGRWSRGEHEAFLANLEVYGRVWKKVARGIPTRTSAQIRSHAQKYFARMRRHRLYVAGQEARAAAGVRVSGRVPPLYFDTQQQLQQPQPFMPSQQPTLAPSIAAATTAAIPASPTLIATVQSIVADPAAVELRVTRTVVSLRERYRRLQGRMDVQKERRRRKEQHLKHLEEQKEQEEQQERKEQLKENVGSKNTNQANGEGGETRYFVTTSAREPVGGGPATAAMEMERHVMDNAETVRRDFQWQVVDRQSSSSSPLFSCPRPPSLPPHPMATTTTTATMLTPPASLTKLSTTFATTTKETTENMTLMASSSSVAGSGTGAKKGGGIRGNSNSKNKRKRGDGRFFDSDEVMALSVLGGSLLQSSRAF